MENKDLNKNFRETLKNSICTWQLCDNKQNLTSSFLSLF